MNCMYGLNAQIANGIRQLASILGGFKFMTTFKPLALLIVTHNRKMKQSHPHITDEYLCITKENETKSSSYN